MTPFPGAAMIRRSAVLLILWLGAVGCGQPAPPPETPAPPDLKKTLTSIAADPAFTDEQALTRFCGVLTDQAGQHELLPPLAPLPPGQVVMQFEQPDRAMPAYRTLPAVPATNLQPVAGGWLIEIHARQWRRPWAPERHTNIMDVVKENREQSRVTARRTVSAVLETGRVRNLKKVRVVLYIAFQQAPGPTGELEVFRATAGPDDAEWAVEFERAL